MKKQVKSMIRVNNVRIGQDVCTVRFKVNHAKELVKCSTKGQKAFVIFQDGDSFVACSRANEGEVFAAHPAKAFAKAVKEFWTLW